MTKQSSGDETEKPQKQIEPDEPSGVGFDALLRRMLDTPPQPLDRTPKPGNTVAERAERLEAWRKRPPVI